jgi:hypothetical protein
MTAIFSAEQACEIADVKPALLELWIKTGKFETSQFTLNRTTGVKSHYFDEKDIARLTKFAESQRPKQDKQPKNKSLADDGTQENFSVAEVAALWNLSTDTIRKLFEDEPGVIPLGNPNPRGKRRRITLRIPRDVMERVKNRMANK